jgi:hypothetical protein
MAKNSILGFVEAIGRKLADEYPKPAPPVKQVDKKTGKAFMAKGQNELTKEIMGARAKIDKDIKAGNYDPYFPLEERFYADPTKYEFTGNTLTDTLPKTQKTIDAKIAQFDTPQARESLIRAYEKSADDPLARDWYAMGQMEKMFIEELGEKEGRKAFKELFADAMAATTGGADPGSNLLMAQYGNYLRQKGLDVPDAAYKMPVPIGGRFVTGNMAMYDKVLKQGNPLTTAGQPKRHNFSANFQGDRSRATIDEQMTSGMTGGKFNAPPQGAYGILENIVADEAAKRGLQSANMQDVAWAGYKGIEGKPMIQFVNEAIERTARLTGRTPDEVARGIPRGMPLYDAGGGLIAAGTIYKMLSSAASDNASPIPGGMSMPSAQAVSEGVRSSQKQGGAETANAILGELLGFMAPTSAGGGVDTMEGYLRSKTR